MTALGVLYDFTGYAKNTTVQKVEDMVKEAWVCVNLDHLRIRTYCPKTSLLMLLKTNLNSSCLLDTCQYQKITVRLNEEYKRNSLLIFFLPRAAGI